MAECVYADDAYLIAHFPAVVVTTPGVWVITVLAVAAGDYTITVGGVPYVYAADGTETPGEIRNALLGQVSMSLAVTSSPTGTVALTLAQVQAGALTVTATGPTPDPPGPSEVSLSQTQGGDNTAQRALWLQSAKLGVPDCCVFQSAPCCGPINAPPATEDFTLWHAALAAHYLLLAINTGPTGYGGAGFKRMELGPATLERAITQYGSATETDLARTEPGMLVLELRRRYLAPALFI